VNRNARDPGGVLPRILEQKREEVRALVRHAARLRAVAEAAPRPPSFEAALRAGDRVAVIAEVKRRSPSAGLLNEAVDVAGLAAAYAEAGAAAISVLPEQAFFGGSVADLRTIRDVTPVPLLRKDFVLAAEQLWEARAAGASAVLLIVRILEDGALRALQELTGELGMAALVEVHDAAELDRALRAGARVVGVNNRDLDTLAVDPERSVQLAVRVPGECVLVGESGVQGVQDVVRLAQAGVDAVLVGEALMRSRDPGAAVRGLAAVRRESRP